MTVGDAGLDDGVVDEGDEGGQRLDVGSGMGGPGDGGPGSAGCKEAEMAAKTNQGCQFWAVDLPNSREDTPSGSFAEEQQYAVAVANNSSSSMVNVNVYLADGTELVDSAVVNPEDVHVFQLPEQSIDSKASTTDGKAYRIESDLPITAYQFNPLDDSVKVYSNDASILFPAHVLTQDYIAVTQAGARGESSYVSIVGTAADTKVTVFAAEGSTMGNRPEATIGVGQVFTVIGGDGISLSGSRVQADKPVAVFSGNSSIAIFPQAQEGAQFEGMPRSCCADHLEHQMMPLQTWGHSYAVATIPTVLENAGHPRLTRLVETAHYSFVGGFDGTTLTYSPARPGGAPMSLDAGEVFEFDSDEAFTVTSSDEAKPFGVFQYMPSGDTTDFIFRLTPDEPAPYRENKPGAGDPAMLALPAAAQFEDKYVFVVPQFYERNRLNVVVPSGGTLSLDGAPLDPAALQAIGSVDGVDYLFGHYDVGEGAHVITGSAAFGLTVHGYGIQVSYGYSGGSGFDLISEPPPPPVG